MVVPFVLACTACNPDVTLLEGPEPELERRRSERRERMNLWEQPLDEDGNPTDEPERVTPEEAVARLWQSCSYVTFEGTPCEGGDGTSDCIWDVCYGQLSLCQAQRLLEIASAPFPVRVDRLGLGGLERKQVLPPSPEAQAALSEHAFERAATAVALAVVSLKKTVGFDLGNEGVGDLEELGLGVDALNCETSDASRPFDIILPDSPTLPEMLATTIVEATTVAEEAARLAAQRYAAVADAEFARSRDVEVASTLAWVDGDLSRARAAHLLVGGRPDSGLFGFWGEGICPAPIPDDATRAAIDALRESGANPEHVYDMTIPSRRLLEGGHGDRDEGIGWRLAERRGDPMLANLGADQLLERLGLSAAGLDRARRYLAHEARAFGRDLGATLPLRMIDFDEGTLELVPTTVPDYVALASRPMPPPEAYLQAITRYSEPWMESDDLEDDLSARAASLVPLSVGYARSSLAALIDYSVSAAHDLLAADTDNPALSGWIPDRAANILARFTGDWASRRPYRLETCYDGDPMYPDRYRVRVYGMSEFTRLKVVSGVGGLRCATEGHVERAPCSLDDHGVPGVSLFLASPGTTSATDHVGFADYATVAFNADFEEETPEWLFVVELIPGQLPGPGAYRAIGSIRAQRMDSQIAGYYYCNLQPVVPDVIATAAELITPNPDNCGRPKRSCAGLDDLSKIPLENELTTDGTELDRSWRYYLDRAMEASSYADQLGEQLIDVGFRIDERIELSEATLEGVCGGAISLRELAWGEVEDARAGECTATEDCPAGYACRGAVCVRDLDATLETAAARDDPVSEALLECVGNDTVVELASLGSRDLCVWRRVGSSRICETPLDGMMEPIALSKPCPYFAPGGDETGPPRECERPAGLPEDWEVVAVRDHLRIFETITEPSPEAEPEPGNRLDCNLIRGIRSGSVELTEDVRRGLQATGFFDLRRLQEVARRIGWRGYPRDYSAITVDGRDKWRTGYPLVTGSTAHHDEGWPCDDMLFAAMTGGERNIPIPCSGRMELDEALFRSRTCHCASVDQAGQFDRARMNLRMARAVLALRIITGAGLTGFEGPYMPRVASLVWEADGNSDACTMHGDSYCNDPEERCSFCDYAFCACDLHRYAWIFPAPEATPFFDGQPLERSDRIDYYVYETNGSDDDATVPVDGAAYCYGGTDSNVVLWTLLRGYEDWPGRPLTAHCDWNGMQSSSAPSGLPGHRQGSSFYSPVLFRRYDGMTPRGSDGAAARIWRGLSAGTGSESTGSPLDAIMYHTLRNPRGGRAERISAWLGNELTDYWRTCHALERDRCREEADRGMEAYNLAKLAREGLTRSDLLDALELACQVDEAEHKTCREAMIIEPRDATDLGRARQRLECIANEILEQARTTVVRNIPRALLGELDPNVFEGERGRELANLINAYQRLPQHQRHISEALQDFARDVETLRTALASTDISRQLAELDRTSQVWAQTTSCAAAIGGAAAGAGSENPVPALLGGGAAAAATCANTVAQIALAYERLDLQREQLELQNGMSWDQFRRQFAAHHARLQDLADQIETEITAIQGANGALEAHRQAARRQLATGLMMGSDTSGRTFATNQVMRARYNTLRMRYEEAHRYAIRMAALARVALEQRLGLDLSTMHEDLSFVEAPARWADAVCTMKGIDYQRISDTSSAVYSFEGDYVGDYVRRLHQVFESYSLDFNFTDGEDRAVVSLRDDVLMSTAPCETAVPNLLGDSANPRGPAWTLEGCEEVPGPLDACGPITPEPDVFLEDECRLDGLMHTPDCVQVIQLATTSALDRPIPYQRQDLGPVNGFQVIFAPGGDDQDPPPLVRSFQPGISALTQRLVLERGVYRLSWRGRVTAFHSPTQSNSIREVTYDAANAVQVRLVDPEHGTLDALETHQPPPFEDTGWPLHYLFFEIEDESAEVRIAVVPLAGEDLRHAVDIGAFMLENVTGAVPIEAARMSDPRDGPTGYIATTAPGTGLRSICEDTFGHYFRHGWAYDCTRLCPTGFGSCTEGSVHCFWERSLSISLEDFEGDTVLGRAGFARGNYNYRAMSVGLNFVGTNIRDCTRTRFGSTCYGAGNIPYSMYHTGIYRVRNHRGDTYDAPLFSGNIEQARGLAAERYLTNPISSADLGLIEPYMRRELSGRPLTGDYVIRIWDDGTIDFDALEDVQVVLRYRYWTRNR